MRYYKVVENGNLVCIGTGLGGEEITEEEYNTLLDEIRASIPVTDEISDEEALNIILGVSE